MFLVQLKVNPASKSFNKNWSQFKIGFSEPDSSASPNTAGSECCCGKSWNAFWIGNELLFKLTNSYKCGLHVFLNVSQEIPELQYSYYDQFIVGSEAAKYRMEAINFARGNCSTSKGLMRVGMSFSTFDQDNDPDGWVNCAARYEAGWWYAAYLSWFGNCGFTNFNTFSPHFLSLYGSETNRLFASQMWLECI
ncbi:hypothetical protein HELRODRAFT_182434 [Helobdella robusta]|uniref:Fibrinogen C-terminal domain-containing protein n=1 Tax=Helobdella robusta TaxID=6412 RepID=T1FI69_HELRO|nr:hypothetical protein HELRODRAFT_182434 [Helobdella robusta]ESN90961.1 hypothetical protein HELRODRAFT_182434 [Helobdella robusta]